ncbi:MAG: glycine-rich domain-containing protein [Bacteroidia bacterium]
MTPDQLTLWGKIKDFELDEPTSSLTFTNRLARENGWTIEYSIRAVHEYKKFIFMLCIADHSLTPSDQVDQVWHLHLLYTQSYWVDFCNNTIGKQIHHGPTKGGKAEGEKYNDLYDKTLLLYKALFERNAPADIWPPKEIRFGDVHFQRVNLDRNWIIKKSRLFK